MDKTITEREAFEMWETNDGAYPRAIERAPDGGYLFMKAATDWNIWQAACKWQRESMQADGWRQCAKGQRTTQFCGQAEAAYAKGAEDMRERAYQEAQCYLGRSSIALAVAIRALPITPTNTEGEHGE